MKKITGLITAFLFLSIFASAQQSTSPKNSIKFGIGTTFLKPDNYFGNNTLHLQYEHRLFKPIRLAVDGFRINANQMQSDGNEKSKQAYQLDAGLNIALFSNANNAFKIGGGATWQKARDRFTTSIERDSNNQVISKTFEEQINENFGWTASVEYEVYVVKHIALGTRLTYKKYQNGETNYYFGLNAGFRF